jgi:hypothetical protein
VLVDYIRFIALPAVTEASYTDNNGSAVIEDGVTVPANAKFINVKLSRPLPGGLKYSMVNEFGNEASIDMANTEYVASENTIKVALASELETSSTYTLAIDSSTDFAQSDVKTVQKLYKPIEYKFDVQPAPIDAVITKGTDSSVVDYTNNTGDDIVLVAIATIWDGNNYVSKNMVVTPVLANSSVNGVVVNHPITGNNTAELVVMQYDAEKGKYTMISKMIY